MMLLFFCCLKLKIRTIEKSLTQSRKDAKKFKSSSSSGYSTKGWEIAGSMGKLPRPNSSKFSSHLGGMLVELYL